MSRDWQLFCQVHLKRTWCETMITFSFVEICILEIYLYLYILPVGYLAFALKRTVIVDVMYTKYYTEVLRVPCPVSCHNVCANG